MEKKFKIITDPRIARMILKANSAAVKKYCPYCGKPLSEDCGCRKDSVVCDIKPNKKNAEATVFCFETNEDFWITLAEIEKELFPAEDVIDEIV